MSNPKNREREFYRTNFCVNQSVQALGKLLQHHPEYVSPKDVANAMDRSSSELNAWVDNGVLERPSGLPIRYRVTDKFLKAIQVFRNSGQPSRSTKRI